MLVSLFLFILSGLSIASPVDVVKPTPVTGQGTFFFPGLVSLRFMIWIVLT